MGMSYLIVIIMGAVVGFIAGQYLKGSQHGSAIDALAGGIGGCIVVAVARLMGPVAATGWLWSSLLAIGGSVATLFIMRQIMMPKPVPSRARRR
jgi:uncharacterized membrane protein YeaQ/YmgE (transglycosylase-associated protein family)